LPQTTGRKAVSVRVLVWGNVFRGPRAREGVEMGTYFHEETLEAVTGPEGKMELFSQRDFSIQNARKARIKERRASLKKNEEKKKKGKKEEKKTEELMTLGPST